VFAGDGEYPTSSWDPAMPTRIQKKSQDLGLGVNYRCEKYINCKNTFVAKS